MPDDYESLSAQIRDMAGAKKAHLSEVVKPKNLVEKLAKEHANQRAARFGRKSETMPTAQLRGAVPAIGPVRGAGPGLSRTARSRGSRRQEAVACDEHMTESGLPRNRSDAEGAAKKTVPAIATREGVWR